jgi:Mn-dependent DtxR family transcriptional regulator
MKGSERQVLGIIKELEEADRESVAFKLGISLEYVVQICSILVKDGYAEEQPNGKFKLTLKGKRTTSPVRTTGPISVLTGGR